MAYFEVSTGLVVGVILVILSLLVVAAIGVCYELSDSPWVKRLASPFLEPEVIRAMAGEDQALEMELLGTKSKGGASGSGW